MISPTERSDLGEGIMQEMMQMQTTLAKLERERTQLGQERQASVEECQRQIASIVQEGSGLQEKKACLRDNYEQGSKQIMLRDNARLGADAEGTTAQLEQVRATIGAFEVKSITLEEVASQQCGPLDERKVAEELELAAAQDKLAELQ